ncbi:MAG: hypothetical protein OWS74_01500 [Firmicutes bacterium]|nr:hypothetical protein [Bacillota bacterium]
MADYEKEMNTARRYVMHQWLKKWLIPLEEQIKRQGAPLTIKQVDRLAVKMKQDSGLFELDRPYLELWLLRLARLVLQIGRE